MALPARGAQALGLKADQARFNKKYPAKPKVPRVPKVKAPSMDEVANRNAMTTFRTALAQLQASQAPVDSAAIYAPYRQSQQVVGQLGQGLQTAVQGAGQAAQTQYAQGRDVAQQHAAQFGISAGAGANPTALQDTGTGALATQTNAYAAAAPQAATAWQQLLERSAAAKVSDAQLARTNVLNQGQASLATNLPSLIGDEKTKLFQQHVQKFNEGVTRTQLDAKQKNDLRDFLLGKARVDATVAGQGSTSAAAAARLAETKRHNLATEKGAKIRAQKAAKTGVKGIPQVLAALKIATPTSTKGLKPVIGHTVTYPSDPNGVNAGAPPLETYVPAGQTPKPPTGYLPPANEGKPVLGQAKLSTTVAGMTLAQWNRAVGIMQTSNPGKSKSWAMKQVQQITPRPKK